jgi:hypothetical protein
MTDPLRLAISIFGSTGDDPVGTFEPAGARVPVDGIVGTSEPAGHEECRALPRHQTDISRLPRALERTGTGLPISKAPGRGAGPRGPPRIGSAVAD